MFGGLSRLPSQRFSNWSTFDVCSVHIVPLGVGIDTSRFGHHVTFLRADLQPTAPPLEMTESRTGYEQLRHRLQELCARHPGVHFHVRLDAAGQYATNLERFLLRSLPFAQTISIGEPARNQHYREAFYPKRQADAVDSQCAARFALNEHPAATPEIPAALYPLRETVSRLEAQTRQSTRLTNQLHNLLARVFRCNWRRHPSRRCSPWPT